jgi:hypothetical protein
MTSENGNASERERAARIIESVRPEQVLAGIGDLIKQVDWSIPKGVYDGEPMWTVVGHALITRMRDTMDSIALLVRVASGATRVDRSGPESTSGELARSGPGLRTFAPHGQSRNAP